MDISAKVKAAVRDIPDFPKEGILFKDITPILSDPQLCKDIVKAFVDEIGPLGIDAIACVEARGFFFGPLIAQELDIPFIPIRKQGKLPYDTITYKYDLEYGSATMEMHSDAVEDGWNVLIHDDLLATGGTASAAAELINMNGIVVGFSFLIDLTFLEGKKRLNDYSNMILSLAEY